MPKRSAFSFGLMTLRQKLVGFLWTHCDTVHGCVLSAGSIPVSIRRRHVTWLRKTSVSAPAILRLDYATPYTRGTITFVYCSTTACAEFCCSLSSASLCCGALGGRGTGARAGPSSVGGTMALCQGSRASIGPALRQLIVATSDQ